MVQLVHQLLSPNRHPQTPGVGEVRQPPSPRLVLLSENDLARRPVLRLPAPNPSLQRPPNPRMQFRMTPHHLFVQRHRPQPRVRLQQRHDLLVEYPRQRVGASPPPRLLHRPTPRIPFDPMRRRPAEPRLRRRQRRPVLPSSGHVQLHLVVRNPSARHFASLLIPGKHQSSNLPPPPPAVSPCLSQASHPDCRATSCAAAHATTRFSCNSAISSNTLCDNGLYTTTSSTRLRNTSSNRTTECGRRRTASVSCPPSS